MDVEKIILASGGDGVKLWDLSSSAPIEEFSTHSDNVSCICWSHNNHLIVSASSSGEKIVISYVKGGSNSTVSELANGARDTCVALNSSSRYLCCGGKSKNISIWDVKSKKLKKILKGHKETVTCVTFNWNDTHIASGSTSGEILIHNVVSGQCANPLASDNAQAIRDIQYSHFKNSMLGAVSDDGALRLWDTNAGKLLHVFSDGHTAPATSLAFSPFNKLLVITCGLDKRIICFDVQSKRTVRTMSVDSPLTSVAFMHNGGTLAVGSSRGKIFVFDLRKGSSPIKTLIGHKSSVQSLKFQNNTAVAKTNGTASKSKITTSQPPDNTSSKKGRKDDRTGESKSPIPPENFDMVGGDKNELGKDVRLEDNRRSSLTETSGGSYNSFGMNIISPLHDGTKDNQGSSSKERPDAVGTEGTKYNDSLTSGGLFSPILTGGNSSQEVRKTPIGSVNDSILAFSKQENKSEAGKKNNSNAINENVMFPSSVISPPQSLSTYYGPSPHANTPYDPTLNPDVLSQLRAVDMIPERERAASVPHVSFSKVDKTPASTLSKFATGSSSIMRNSNPAKGLLGGSSQYLKNYSSPIPEMVSLETADDSHEPGEPPPLPAATSEPAPQGSQPLQSFQVEFIRNMIEESLEEFREAIHLDITNLQLEMLRQFQIQQNEIQALLQRYSVNDGLLAEIERLREENKRLKSTL